MESKLTAPIIPDTLPPPLETIPFQKWVPLFWETLERDGRLLWRVEGESMRPTLPPGCTIEIHAIKGRISLGTLLVFAEQGALVVHRLVARRGERLVLQGDNRKIPDLLIQPEQVIGYVVKATYQEALIYPHKFIQLVAIFMIARYYWLMCLRFLLKG